MCSFGICTKRFQVAALSKSVQHFAFSVMLAKQRSYKVHSMGMLLLSQLSASVKPAHSSCLVFSQCSQSRTCKGHSRRLVSCDTVMVGMYTYS